MAISEKRRTELIEKVAEALRAIGQPDTTDLIFVCEGEGSFAELGDEILGIPLYKVPFLQIRGGLLLASKEVGWTPLSQKLLRFQGEMEL